MLGASVYIYGGKAKATLTFARLARLHAILLEVARLYASGRLDLPLVDGWDVFFPF